MKFRWKFLEILRENKNFLGILGKLELKFELFSSKILSKLWLNFWENFVEISGKLSRMNISNIFLKFLGILDKPGLGRLERWVTVLSALYLGIVSVIHFQRFLSRPARCQSHQFSSHFQFEEILSCWKNY